MSYIMKGKDSVSFKQLSKDLGFMERTKTWRNSWRALLETKKLIEPIEAGASVFTGEFQLTAAGKEHASTPEYKEYLQELNFCPQSNTEHQERIKKRLVNKKAIQIFDLLTKHGSLSRKELSVLLKCNDRSHNFSYGLQDLRENKKLVEKDGGKFRLTDEAFLDPDSDRPEPVAVDPNDLAEGEAHIASKKRSSGNQKQDKERPDGEKKKESKKRKSGEME